MGERTGLALKFCNSIIGHEWNPPGNEWADNGEIIKHPQISYPELVEFHLSFYVYGQQGKNVEESRNSSVFLMFHNTKHTLQEIKGTYIALATFLISKDSVGCPSTFFPLCLSNQTNG